MFQRAAAPALSSLSAATLKPLPLHVVVFSSPLSSPRPLPLCILRCCVVYSGGWVEEKMNNEQRWGAETFSLLLLLSFLFFVFLFFSPSSCLFVASCRAHAYLATFSLLLIFVFSASQVICCFLSIEGSKTSLPRRKPRPPLIGSCNISSGFGSSCSFSIRSVTFATFSHRGKINNLVVIVRRLDMINSCWHKQCT